MFQYEYYIRQPSDTDARGPFTLGQIAKLASSGGLNANTLFFDADADEWRPAASAPELVALLPARERERARLVLALARPPARIPTAALLLGGALAFAAPALVSPGGFDADALLRHPCLWLGVLDLLLALLVFAFAARAPRLFAVVRVRAGLGFGFLATLFWLQANTAALVAALAASACLWMASTLAAARARAVNAIAGLAALAALAYCLL